MLSGLDSDLRDSLVGTEESRRNFFNTYEYQATEIYAAMRQRRYERIPGFTPHHGAITANPNITLRLTQLKDRWHPDVVRAVLVDLLQQAVDNPEMQAEDIEYLRTQIQAVMGYSLPLPARTVRSRPSDNIDWSHKGCCFPGFVTVNTPEGLKPIENIEAGQSVIILNKQTGKVEQSNVLEVQVHRGEFHMLNIEVSGKTIPVTTRHRFARESQGYGWCSSEMLQKNDKLVTATSTAFVTDVSQIYNSHGLVYNLKVKESCYFVSEAEVLVRDF